MKFFTKVTILLVAVLATGCASRPVPVTTADQDPCTAAKARRDFLVKQRNDQRNLFYVSFVWSPITAGVVYACQTPTRRFIKHELATVAADIEKVCPAETL